MQASDGPVGAPVVLIGDLAVSDNPAVVSLWEESELTRPWNDPELDIRRALAGSSSTVLTARDGTVLAGTVMVGHDGHRGWVYYLAVASSYRSHGVAGHLMSAAEQWLRSRGAVKVQLMVRKGNAGVGDLYVHLGYEEAAVTTYAKWLVRRVDDWVRAFTDAFSTASHEVLAEVQLVEAYDLGRGVVGIVTQNGPYLRGRRFHLRELEAMTRHVDAPPTVAYALIVGEIVPPSDLVTRRSELPGEERHSDASWSGSYPDEA